MLVDVADSFQIPGLVNTYFTVLTPYRQATDQHLRTTLISRQILLVGLLLTTR